MYARATRIEGDAAFLTWATPLCLCLYALVIDAIFALVRGDRSVTLWGHAWSRPAFSFALAALVACAHVPLRIFPPTAAQTGSFIRMSIADLVGFTTLFPAMGSLDLMGRSRDASRRRDAATPDGLRRLLTEHDYWLQVAAPRNGGGALLAVGVSSSTHVLVIDADGRLELGSPLSAVALPVRVLSMRELASGDVAVLGSGPSGVVIGTLAGDGFTSHALVEDSFTSDRYRVAWRDDGGADVVRASFDGVRAGVVLRVDRSGSTRALPFMPELGERQWYDVTGAEVAGGVLYVAYAHRGMVDVGPRHTFASAVWRFAGDEPTTLGSATKDESIEALAVGTTIDVLVKQPRIELPHAESNTPLVLRRYDLGGKLLVERAMPSSGLSSDAIVGAPDGGAIFVRDFAPVRVDRALVEDRAWSEAAAHSGFAVRPIEDSHMPILLSPDAHGGVMISIEAAQKDDPRLPLLCIDASGRATPVTP